MAIRRSSSSDMAFQSFSKADSSLGSLVRNILSNIVYIIYYIGMEIDRCPLPVL